MLPENCMILVAVSCRDLFRGTELAIQRKREERALERRH
jgi:hypothetical protein